MHIQQTAQFKSVTRCGTGDGIKLAELVIINRASPRHIRTNSRILLLSCYLHRYLGLLDPIDTPNQNPAAQYSRLRPYSR